MLKITSPPQNNIAEVEYSFMGTNSAREPNYSHSREASVGLDIKAVRAAVDVLGRGAVEGDGAFCAWGTRRAAELRGGGVRA